MCKKNFRRVKKKFILGEKIAGIKKYFRCIQNILKINEEKLSPFLSEKRKKSIKKLTNFP